MSKFSLALLCISPLLICSGCGMSTASAQDNSPAPATEPFHGTIKVDGGQVIRDIPRSLFGTNLEWFYNGNNIWDGTTGTIQPRILQQARDLGVSVIRFPGGALADYYHWQDGVGPVDKRPVRDHVIDSGRSANLVGTDELLTLSGAVGAEPLISVNVVTGSPEEAAAWVAYCNRPTQRVRYWEIGNEQYMKHDGKTSKSGMSAAQYADRVVAFSRAMRQVDPNIKIFAVGGTNFGRYTFVNDPNWDTVLLSKASGSFDYLSVHNAYAPVLINAENISAADAYAALLAFPKLFRDNMATLGSQVDQAPPQDRGRIRLAITEWGPLFHVLPSSRWVQHTSTVGSGIFVASMMNAFLESQRLDVANFFKLTEGSFMGWIEHDSTVKPSAEALSLYTQHFGTKLTTTAVDSPTFDAKAAGVVAEVRNVPYLDAVSSLSPDGKRLYVIAINKHFGAPASTDVEIPGFSTTGGRRWVLSGASLDANNGPDVPAVPGLTWAKQAEYAPNPQFSRGAPGTVRISESALAVTGSRITLTLPPLSVTAIELNIASGSSHATAR